MFLLAHALRATPCVEAAKMFESEAERLGLIGQTSDRTGNKRNTTFSDLARLFPHVSGQSLKRIAVSQTVDSNQPRDLSKGKVNRSTGRTPDQPSILLLDAPKLKSSSILRTSTLGRACSGRGNNCNEIALLLMRELGCRVSRRPWRPHIYQRINIAKSVMGHFMAVYCLIWDKTGQIVITGSDDKLIKMWEARTCRLVRTLRGHVNDIADLTVSCDNRFLASAGTDCDIRIWWLHNGFPALVLPGHTNLISNILFSPCLTATLSHVLVSTGTDGTTRIWTIDSAGRLMGHHIYSTEESPSSSYVPIAGQHLSVRRRVEEVRCSAISLNGLWIAYLWLPKSSITRPKTPNRLWISNLPTRS